MLCALSVDNRILTVFKEEKIGRREEIENVEVKLFDAGMFVYELHTSGHDYVTDELWAAFYKKLLVEGLVPRIVLSDESPGFDWIKQFVKPGLWFLSPCACGGYQYVSGERLVSRCFGIQTKIALT